MPILIRKTRYKNDAIIDQRDSEFHSDTLTLGSAATVDLQLHGEGIAPQHAKLSLATNGQITVSAVGEHYLQVNGEHSSSVDMEPGKAVKLGPHSLELIEVPPGFHAALELRIDDAAKPDIASRHREALRPKLPSTRVLSYLGALLVIIGGLGIPLLGYFQPGVDSTLQALSLPDDSAWLSGPLSAPHHVPGVADDCQSCHSKPFRQVGNAECSACHQDTTVHFVAPHPGLAVDAESCTDCHKEHNEPSMLIVGDDRLCVDCHKRPLARAADSIAQPDTVPTATAFSEADHPAFKLTLLHLNQHNGDKLWQRQAIAQGQTQIRERSNLKFSHQLHLAGNEVKLDDGNGHERDLQCADCHSLANDGEHFKTITMETHCQGCHSLDFNDQQPQRQLPHTDGDELYRYLEEFYVSAAVKMRDTNTPQAERWVPNWEMKERCEGLDTLECGLRLADWEAEQLFNKTGCINCHEVSTADGHTPKRWQVKPVRLVDDWFSSARFDHRPHLVGTEGAAATCLSCHSADSSEQASDVLIPTLNTCVSCHGADQHNQRELQCVDCHAYHRDGMATMSVNMPASHPSIVPGATLE